MKNKFKLLVMALFLFSFATPLFAQERPPTPGPKRCEKYYRGPDGKIIRQIIPCPNK